MYRAHVIKTFYFFCPPPPPPFSWKEYNTYNFFYSGRLCQSLYRCRLTTTVGSFRIKMQPEVFWEYFWSSISLPLVQTNPNLQPIFSYSIFNKRTIALRGEQGKTDGEGGRRERGEKNGKKGKNGHFGNDLLLYWENNILIKGQWLYKKILTLNKVDLGCVTPYCKNGKQNFKRTVSLDQVAKSWPKSNVVCSSSQGSLVPCSRLISESTIKKSSENGQWTKGNNSWTSKSIVNLIKGIPHVLCFTMKILEKKRYNS